MKLFAAAAIAACVTVPAAAQPSLAPDLTGVGFLVGHWKSDDGKVSDTGGTSKGSSTITVEANGEALLRRDHTDLFDKAGKPAGGFDQIMLIYSEGGVLHADYSDGQHVIHYTKADVVAGKSVTFTSAAPPGAPAFQLHYEVQSPGALALTFGMIPPGQTAARPIAAGTLHRGS
jgi:hypothetical protein